MPAPPDKILLVGMMGAGKSTVGRLLAERLGWAYLDSDDQVVLRTGRTVPELFAEGGEAAFRTAEKLALAEALASAGPAVVSVAGGAVLDPDNRERLTAAGTVVWLRGRVDTLAARVGAGEGRPLLGDDPSGALGRLEAERRPLYEGVAGVVVDIDDLTPEDVAARILQAVA